MPGGLGEWRCVPRTDLSGCNKGRSQILFDHLGVEIEGTADTGPQLHCRDAIDLDIERPMPPRHKDQLASRRLNHEEATIHVIDD